ncbi:MAG: four helix bundle protein [Parcubacteria group bacterium]
MINNEIENFQDIIAWQKAHTLVLEIYKTTKTFPYEEKFGLVSQMRRAIISFELNIVEGFARRKIKETLNFYNIANASLEEIKCQILICHDLNFINQEKYDDLIQLSSEAGRILHGWIKSQRANCGLSC